MPTDLTINLLLANQARFLTVPRFAVMTWSGMLGSVLLAAGQTKVAAVSLLLCFMGVARLIWVRLLPHEAARLNKADKALADARPDRAIEILERRLPLAGTHYWLLRSCLLSKALIREGRFTQAHAALLALDEKAFFVDELDCLRCAWAHLYLEAGNPNEAARYLDEIDPKACRGTTQCVLLKSAIDIQHGNYNHARDLLEHRLTKSKSVVDRILLLNNLSIIERNQQRPLTHLERLQAARAALKKAPRADLTASLHHNLAIALVRAGRVAEARIVLSEAMAAGDSQNIRHVLEVLNNELFAAREAQDTAWKQDVYSRFDNHLAQLKTVTANERFALDVSQLRMRRNDGFRTVEDYVGLIQRILADYDAIKGGLTLMECLNSLREIRHDVQREWETSRANRGGDPLMRVEQTLAARLVILRDAVDTYLYEIPPKLIGPVETWRKYQTEIDKAEIFLATDSKAAQAGFEHLFNHLRERAEWLTAQGMAHSAIEGWIVLCDEYVAYRDQQPHAEREHFASAYLPLANKALDQTIVLLKQQTALQDHVPQLIAVAYFSLKLRNDQAVAAHWFGLAQSFNPAMDQYATWLREHYAWVAQELSSAEFTPS
jgi:hypothetical protein